MRRVSGAGPDNKGLTPRPWIPGLTEYRRTDVSPNTSSLCACARKYCTWSTAQSPPSAGWSVKYPCLRNIHVFGTPGSSDFCLQPPGRNLRDLHNNRSVNHVLLSETSMQQPKPTITCIHHTYYEDKAATLGRARLHCQSRCDDKSCDNAGGYMCRPSSTPWRCLDLDHRRPEARI